MGERLTDRLTEIGLAETAEIALGATIRPVATALAATATADQAAADHASTEEHRPASPPATRPLPQISVDLRRSFDATRVDDRDETTPDLELTGLIGEGGMGRVFLARQHSLQREVAVKTVKDDAPRAVREALLLEGCIAGQLEHPAIVPVHVLGTDRAGRPAMVMKRIEGVSYDVLIRDPAHRGWESWDGDPSDRLPGHLQILTQICNALLYAHRHGIVHRDLKPENVLIGEFGDVYLADWGIATRLDEDQDRRLCGTPGYMAPEMVVGNPVDARTDVYLLGATLHEILTQRPRHDVESFEQALRAATLSAPFDYDEDVPEALADLANRACAPDPDDRPPSARAFREALATYLQRRDSIALAGEAEERLAQLKPLLATSKLDPDARREVEQLSAAARFGFEQAMSRWEGNDRAREGLEGLDQLLEARRARALELERLAHERDPTVSAGARAVALIGLTVVSAVVVAVAVRSSAQGLPLLIYPSAILVAIILGAAVYRKRLLGNAFNRQTVLLLVTLMGTLVISRAFHLLRPGTVADLFIRDSLIMACALAVSAFTLLRWAAWIALIMLAVAIGCGLFPDEAFYIFGAGSLGAVVVGAIFAWRTRGEPEAPA